MFYENEYLIHYSEDFIIPWVQSDYFRILTIDRNIYKMPESASEERSGFLVYAHRVNPPLEQLPDWCKPYTVISMRNPVAPVELAELYKRSRGLIMYERSAAYAEALLCGCPIILVPGAALPEFPKVLNEFSNLGVAWGLDLDQYEHAAKTAALFSKAYTSSELLDQQKFQVTIHKIIDHFKQKHLESSFNPSIEMELAKNEYKNGLFKNAILRYDKIIGQSKANIEAYYRMTLALVKINMLDAARTVLLKGENKLSAMPEHNSLNGVRTLYYNLLTRISLTVKDDEQAEKFKELFLKYNTITAKIEPDLRL
jgi:tetratricopeptide (TPR) repeat protein